ncbi:MAG: hypothetical protein A4E50_01268 [Methanosaeta sp. PtaB.Bin087]|jgi:hypothetical protein|nr:MAG: hypothetical protein A4E50_01268 [Methanosaeta sp. PtaB.Bin087]OPY56827.1 MAG: hypothetical protein A4E51_00284 [Methanosaeta sp. PtaU1.Bin055]
MRIYQILLLIYIMLSPSAMAIDMYFSASSGPGSSVAIIDSYQVSDGVQVKGETKASFDDFGIVDSRWMEGAGSADAFQRYAGSGGYSGMSRFLAEDALIRMAGGANLKAEGFGASQTAAFEGSYGLAAVGATDRDGDWAETSVEAFDTITRTRMIAATGSAAVVQETESSGSEIHLDTRTHSSGGFSAATHSWVSGGDIRFSGMGHADPEEAMAYQRSEGQGTDVGITTSGFYYDPRRDWLPGDDYTEIYSHVSDGSMRSESLVRTDGDGSASWQDLFAAAGVINLQSESKEFHVGVPGFIRDEEHSRASVDIQPSGGTDAEFSGRMTASMGASTGVKLQGVLRGSIHGDAEANDRTATVDTDGNYRLRMESQTDDDYVWMEIDTEEI